MIFKILTPLHNADKYLKSEFKKLTYSGLTSAWSWSKKESTAPPSFASKGSWHDINAFQYNDHKHTRPDFTFLCAQDELCIKIVHETLLMSWKSALTVFWPPGIFTCVAFFFCALVTNITVIFIKKSEVDKVLEFWCTSIRDSWIKVRKSYFQHEIFTCHHIPWSPCFLVVH